MNIEQINKYFYRNMSFQKYLYQIKIVLLRMFYLNVGMKNTDILLIVHKNVKLFYETKALGRAYSVFNKFLIYGHFMYVKHSYNFLNNLTKVLGQASDN